MNEVLKINQSGGFSSEEEFQRIYEECLEDKPQAPETVRNGYDRMNSAFEEYLCTVEEDVFRYAYQCGYEAALKGGAVA